MKDEFEAFYRESHRAVLRVASRHVTDREEAEDITQEAFARCFVRWKEVRTYESPLAWTVVVASNIACSRLRRMLRARRIALRPVEGEESSASMVEWRVDVVRALAKLPDQQRTALVLHYVADLSVADICHYTGRSPSSVKTDLHRGRKKLASLLEAKST